MGDLSFFLPARQVTVREISALTGARIAASTFANVPITGVASAQEGGEGKLVFIDGKKNAGLFAGLRAGAVLCTPEMESLAPEGMAVLVTPRPSLAFSAVARLLYPTAARPAPLTGETRNPLARVN